MDKVEAREKSREPLIQDMFAAVDDDDTKGPRVVSCIHCKDGDFQPRFPFDVIDDRRSA